jgi:hypothetical protein
MQREDKRDERRTGMNERELADRTVRLPDSFASRLADRDVDDLRSMAAGGEWGLLLDELIATLRVTGAPVSVDELDELRTLLTGWGMPTGQLDGLIVRGGS